jgi:ubiquinone/menaquinone biosynthesis C-methylase UbiE
MAIEKSKSPDAFIGFERAGWDANIAGYDRAFGSVSRQTVRPLLDAANVGPGMRVLDVCTGPGMSVQAALDCGAHAVGLDFSQAVVDLARRLVPAGEFHQGDAQALPFPDNSFDAVVCAYGIIHVPVPEMALREMLRVVRPAGRVAVSVWDSTTPNNGFGMIYAAVRAHGSLDVPVPHGPDYFQFSTEEKMRGALTEIGFSHVETAFVDQRWRVQSATQILEAMRSGTVRARAVLAAQSEAATTDIRQFIEKTLTDLANPAGGFDVPLPALIGSGAKR